MSGGAGLGDLNAIEEEVREAVERDAKAAIDLESSKLCHERGPSHDMRCIKVLGHLPPHSNGKDRWA